MNIIPFPNDPKNIKPVFTRKEAERFEQLKELLPESVSPGEAKYYRDELERLLARGRNRAREKKR